jgi:hypothetical protein
METPIDPPIPQAGNKLAQQAEIDNRNKERSMKRIVVGFVLVVFSIGGMYLLRNTKYLKTGYAIICMFFITTALLLMAGSGWFVYLGVVLANLILCLVGSYPKLYTKLSTITLSIIAVFLYGWALVRQSVQKKVDEK